jgi:hypothetical protein
VTTVAGTTAILVVLLGVAVLVALGAERLRIPSAVALVAFGAGTAAIHPVPLPFHFGDTLLFIFLPPKSSGTYLGIQRKRARGGPYYDSSVRITPISIAASFALSIFQRIQRVAVNHNKCYE